MNRASFTILLSFLASIVLGESCRQSERKCTTLLDDALLWRIAGNGLSQESYLFGTLHSASSSILDSIPELNSALQQSECIVTEVDPQSELSIGSILTSRDFTKYVLPKDIDYADLYSVQDYYIVDDLLFRNNLGKLKRMRLSPIALKYLLMLSSFTNKQTNIPIDKAFVEKAYTLKKDVIFLEGANQQLDFLFSYFDAILPDKDSYTIQEQANDLLDFAENDTLQTLNSKLTTQYLNRNLSELDCDPVFYNILIAQRNKCWLPKLIKQMKKEPCFIAIGVYHLIGENGLVKLLREKGYEVTPIK